MARSLPVLLVPLVNYLFFGQTVTPPALGGMLVITTGCFILPLDSTGYTLVEPRALTALGELQPGLSRVILSITYSKQGKKTLKILIKTRIRGALGAGFFLTLSYLLVLRAMAESVNVSYVAALRQISIPLGAVPGFVILKEKPLKIKLSGILFVFSGLIITGLN